MAAICPNCNSADVQSQFSGAFCLTCGKALNSEGDGVFTVADRPSLDSAGPADTSLATPTATPVYAEQQKDRQPAVDTNLEPVWTNAAPGPTTQAAPDLEAQNVAGELSDETPQEKKSGGPDDQPRSADLTKTGKPTSDSKVDNTEGDLPQAEFVAPTEADQTDLSQTPGAVNSAPTQEQP